MFKKVWALLGSVRLAIILIIIFSLVALAGIVIPQGLHPEQYIKKWGDVFGNLILSAGINHIFSTRWFYFLLELLSLNVLVCSTSRLFKNIKRSYKFKFWASREKLSTFKLYHTITIPSDIPVSDRSIITFMKRRLYAVSSQPSDQGVQVCALKGRLKAYGSFLFHIGIVVLFLGGLYGRMKGHTYHQQLNKGEIVQVKDRDFLLRCDWFELEKNEHGIVKDYKSKLSLLNADSSMIKQKVIEVNSPLSHRGIRFYQSNYGLDPENLKDVMLNIKGPEFSSQGMSYSFEYDREVYVPHSDLKVHILQFIPDFSIDMKTKKAFSRTKNLRNPAMKVILLKGADTLFNHWLFEKFPGQHAPEGNYQVSLIKYTPEYFTGLQVRNNPGVPLIWVSIIIMTFGIFISFYSTKETLWIFIEPAAEDTRKIHISGLLQEGFAISQTRFDNICQSIDDYIKKS